MEQQVLLENKDLRRNDYYLTSIEKENWDNRNILYNTLWFYLNKGKAKGIPDVEYCDEAIESYKRIKVFSKWDTVKRSDGGKVLVSNDGNVLTADLMTGWWNPTKYYLRWNSRNDISEKLLNEIPSNCCEDEVIKWISDRTGNSDCSAKAFLEFLKVIYTEGNIIPAPINWKGNGIDSWMYKLEDIKNNNTCNNAGTWNSYISDNFRDFENFIKQNLLEMYIENNTVVSFWGENRPKPWTKATVEQWKDYFENVKKYIVRRNIELNNSFKQGTPHE